jgi:hypothetical protein
VDSWHLGESRSGTGNADLYSTQYGVWGAAGPRPSENIRLSPGKLRAWLCSRESRIAWATAFGKIIGYAIAVQTNLSDLGVVSWVTQLVVHRDHRNAGIGRLADLKGLDWLISRTFEW